VRSPHSLMDAKVASYGEANRLWTGAEAAGFAKIYGVQQILARQVQDIHFDYDKSDIRFSDQSILQGDASALKTIFQMDANFIVTIEGHCDERGSAEYNLALGDRRAAATKDALIALGVPGEKLKTVSFGKERPICTDASEDCYARNRRAHFAATQ